MPVWVKVWIAVWMHVVSTLHHITEPVGHSAVLSTCAIKAPVFFQLSVVLEQGGWANFLRDHVELTPELARKLLITKCRSVALPNGSI